MWSVMRLGVCATVLVSMFAGVGMVLAAEEKTEPTPYPTKDADWPGKGVIRKFGWMDDNRKYFWTQREADQGKIVFVGDSMIGGWKLENDFPGMPVANRGIGGDVTRGLLFRFQEDVLDLHPKAIVIHIGGNDLTADGTVDSAVSNYNAILDLVQKADPKTPVIIMAVLPMGIPTGDKAPTPELAAYLKKVHSRIPLLDAELAKLPAARKNVVFVDTYKPFLLPDGKVDTSQYNDDLVHPTDAGHTKLGGLVSKALAGITVQSEAK